MCALDYVLDSTSKPSNCFCTTTLSNFSKLPGELNLRNYTVDLTFDVTYVHLILSLDVRNFVFWNDMTHMGNKLWEYFWTVWFINLYLCFFRLKISRFDLCGDFGYLSIYLFIYLFMHVCCMHVCMYVSMYVCKYVSVYVCMYVCLYVCRYIMYVMYVMYVCMYVCKYVCM